MDQIIELIPVVELPTLKDDDSMNHPAGSSLTNTLEWDSFQESEIKKNYQNIGAPITPGVYLYPLFDITTDDLIQLIKLHISDNLIEESCSLFGGFVLKLNGEKVLYPQCCGLLEEINDWVKLLNKGFEPFCLMECHPSPSFSQRSNIVCIDCSEENNESFFPITKHQILLDYDTLVIALEKVLLKIETFSEKLDALSGIFDSKNISKILIWGKNE